MQAPRRPATPLLRNQPPDRLLVEAKHGLTERGHVRWRQLVLAHGTSPTAGCRMVAHRTQPSGPGFPQQPGTCTLLGRCS